MTTVTGQTGSGDGISLKPKVKDFTTKLKESRLVDQLTLLIRLITEEESSLILHFLIFFYKYREKQSSIYRYGNRRPPQR